jgi:serine/threonine-protein kinase RsbW
MMTDVATLEAPAVAWLAEPESLWDEERRLSSGKALGMLEPILKRMKKLGYCNRDLFGVQLALEEAIVNAIRHGNQGDLTRSIRIAYRLCDGELLVEIEDEGDGFDCCSIPDPLAPENLERPCGRGLLLMRSYMTWVRYHGRGNRVSMCKRRTVA